MAETREQLIKAFNFHFDIASEAQQSELLKALRQSYDDFARIALPLNNRCPDGWKECNGTCIPVNDPCS
ncbi:MAG: hypothetical protein U0Y68_09335 [Blastocatellia bacterium]